MQKALQREEKQTLDLKSFDTIFFCFLQVNFEKKKIKKTLSETSMTLLLKLWENSDQVVTVNDFSKWEICINGSARACSLSNTH